MNEPVSTVQTGERGRPEYSEEQYKSWLNEMEPFLKNGNSLYYSCSKAGLEYHYTAIRRKYKVSDWFSTKIDAYRATPGELVNNTLVKLTKQIIEKVNDDRPINGEDFNVLKLMAEKHRTSQPFFVTRTEEAKADDSKLGKIIDMLDSESNYDDVATEAEKQMVAANAPVQNKEQTGQNSSVQAEPGTA